MNYSFDYFLFSFCNLNLNNMTKHLIKKRMKYIWKTWLAKWLSISYWKSWKTITSWLLIYPFESILSRKNYYSIIDRYNLKGFIFYENILIIFLSLYYIGSVALNKFFALVDWSQIQTDMKYIIHYKSIL